MTKLFLFLIAATYFDTPKCPQGYENAHVRGCITPTVVGKNHQTHAVNFDLTRTGSVKSADLVNTDIYSV